MNILHKQVVIIGGGISGLSSAFFLRKKGLDVLVLDQNSVAGGVIRSEWNHEFLLEHGPNSTLETNSTITQLIRDIGLEENKIYASPASNNRYIVRNGELIPLPMSLIKFVGTKLFSTRAKLRLMAEPFAPGPPGREETLAEFTERRVGKEFLDYAVNPFIAGVYAGDPTQLSVRSAMPKLYALEKNYGGLILGAIKSVRERKQKEKTGDVNKQKAKMFSFRNGMEELPAKLYQKTKESVRLNVEVEQIWPAENNGFRIGYQEAGEEVQVEADAVLFAGASFRTSKLLRPINERVANHLDLIPYAPIAIVFLGFQKNQMKHPLDGFGFLVPQVENRKILGTIFSSTIFPNRAPGNGAALTVFVGGTRQPQLVDWSDKDLLKMVQNELHYLLGLTTDPDFYWIKRWQRSIPQYHLGHWKIQQEMDRFEKDFPGLFITGNYREGISVADCVAHAEKIATRISEFCNYIDVNPRKNKIEIMS